MPFSAVPASYHSGSIRRPWRLLVPPFKTFSYVTCYHGQQQAVSHLCPEKGGGEAQCNAVSMCCGTFCTKLLSAYLYLQCLKSWLLSVWCWIIHVKEIGLSVCRYFKQDVVWLLGCLLLISVYTKWISQLVISSNSRWEQWMMVEYALVEIVMVIIKPTIISMEHISVA